MNIHVKMFLVCKDHFLTYPSYNLFLKIEINVEMNVCVMHESQMLLFELDWYWTQNIPF